MAATFGYNGILSLAQFNMTTEQRNQLDEFLDVSFFFRTRQLSGLLFYIGAGTMDSSQTNVTYVTMQLNEGRLLTRLKLTDAELLFQGTSGNLADGQQHFVQLQRNVSRLQLVINSNSRDFALNDSRPLMASVVFVGGIPSSQGRRRREAQVTPGVTPGVTPFVGTTQDIRLNDIVLQIFVVNQTDASLPQMMSPSAVTGVREGELTSDICRIQQPCENNATCENIFFNDF